MQTITKKHQEKFHFKIICLCVFGIKEHNQSVVAQTSLHLNVTAAHTHTSIRAGEYSDQNQVLMYHRIEKPSTFKVYAIQTIFSSRR